MVDQSKNVHIDIRHMHVIISPEVNETLLTSRPVHTGSCGSKVP